MILLKALIIWIVFALLYLGLALASGLSIVFIPLLIFLVLSPFIFLPLSVYILKITKKIIPISFSSNKHENLKNILISKIYHNPGLDLELYYIKDFTRCFFWYQKIFSKKQILLIPEKILLSPETIEKDINIIWDCLLKMPLKHRILRTIVIYIWIPMAIPIDIVFKWSDFFFQKVLNFTNLPSPSFMAQKWARGIVDFIIQFQRSDKIRFLSSNESIDTTPPKVWHSFIIGPWFNMVETQYCLIWSLWIPTSAYFIKEK